MCHGHVGQDHRFSLFYFDFIFLMDKGKEERAECNPTDCLAKYNLKNIVFWVDHRIYKKGTNITTLTKSHISSFIIRNVLYLSYSVWIYITTNSLWSADDIALRERVVYLCYTIIFSKKYDHWLAENQSIAQISHHFLTNIIKLLYVKIHESLFHWHDEAWPISETIIKNGEIMKIKKWALTFYIQ